MSGAIFFSSQSNMSPVARRFVKALVGKFPQFQRHLCVLPNGDFEAYITAPRTSKAGALVCLSHGSDVCVRFALPRAVYAVDSTKELVTIVEQLLRNELVFVLLSTQRKWSGTTLSKRSDRPVQGAGESARLISWSGKFDRYIRASGKRKTGRSV